GGEEVTGLWVGGTAPPVWKTGGPGGPGGGGDGPAMPLEPASSVRSADCTASEDASCISDFGLAISDFLARVAGGRRRAIHRRNGLLTIIVLTPLTTFSRPRELVE